MPLREIVTVPADILRQKAKKVPRVTPELQQLIDDMIETMREAPGVGLAAPQVGVGLRVIVVEYGEPPEEEGAEPPPKKLYAVVNPEISRHNNETVAGTEGCLSIPEYMGEVERYTQVTVKGLDRHGKPLKLKAKDWLARVFQHEIDHINGVLFIDRATRLFRVEPQEESDTPETV